MDGYKFRKGDLVKLPGSNRIYEVDIARRNGNLELSEGGWFLKTTYTVPKLLTLVCMKQDRCDLPGSTAVERPSAAVTRVAL